VSEWSATHKKLSSGKFMDFSEFSLFLLFFFFTGAGEEDEDDAGRQV
jgi:hypothetical protein